MSQPHQGPIADKLAAALPDEVERAAFDPVPRPPDHERRWWGRHWAELRWQAELLALVCDPLFYGHGVPRGGGGPVLLVPGFLAGDQSLLVLAHWLRRIGYDPYPAGIVCNVDCSDRSLVRLDRVLHRIHRRTGRKVALVGHSRGGHFVKALAHRRPALVSGVVSMGAALDRPFDISIPTKAAVAGTRAVLTRLSRRARDSGCFTDSCRCAFTQDFAAVFPRELPLTSIYSRRDGVVWWEACVVPYARNVEVASSHLGLAFNRYAYREVAAALGALGHAEPSQDRPARQRPAAG